VFVTKHRHRVFGAPAPRAHGTDHARRLRDVEDELVEFNGEANHVHLVVNFPPKITLSRLVNSL
jgi:putative transposase